MILRNPVFAVFLMSVVVVGCSGAAVDVTRAQPDWLDLPPNGRCATGYSGATLRPFDAVRYAEAAARASLAMYNSASVEVKNISATSEDAHDLATLQQFEQTLSNVVVVDVWTDRNGVRGDRGSVWARVCHRSSVPARIGIKGMPQWVLNVPRDRLCTVAYCGRTIRPQDQEANLLEYGRYRLAETLSVHNRIALADQGGELEMGAVEDVPDWAVEQASSATIIETWLDKEGRGPIGEPDTLYGLLCL